MAIEKCRKCGVWNCAGGDSCRSDLYDNGVEDVIAAVQEHCDHKPERDRLNCDCKMFEALVREKTGVKK